MMSVCPEFYGLVYLRLLSLPVRANPPPHPATGSSAERFASPHKTPCPPVTSPCLEIIVQFKPQVSLQSLNRLSVGVVELEQVRPLSLERTFLYRANLNREDTLALLHQLQEQSDVAYAHPNYLLFAQAIPNDPEYSNQRWHYEAIRLPEAWDIEKGTSSPVTVAVIDGGVPTGHPDFAGKLLPGYDFYSDAATSGDGDGRDPNPEDTAPGTDYHGSHVTGTVAAATNNNLGVPGSPGVRGWCPFAPSAAEAAPWPMWPTPCAGRLACA